MVLVSILASGNPTQEDFQSAEPVLLDAAEKDQDDVALMFSLANVRIMQQRLNDAEQLYRQVLQLKPKHLLALNNLATLLSEQPAKSQEAIRYIDEAISIAGSQPSLLDTKGMALVHGGKSADAVPLLKSAASSVDGDPRFVFHLAVAYLRVNDKKNAEDAYAKAVKDRLHEQFLTEKDKQLLAELQREFPEVEPKGKTVQPGMVSS